VVLLLGVAVILPTVCLLWFMGEVVKNERLVVRQKLVDFHTDRLADVTVEMGEAWADHCRGLSEEHATLTPYERFLRAAVRNGFDGLILYDADGQRLYPALASDSGTLTRPAEVFADAWELEFVTQDYERAAARYEQYARISEGRARLAARVGKSRSLAKLGQLDAAIHECSMVVSSPLAQSGDSATLSLVANAGLLLLHWAEGSPDHSRLLEQTFRDVLAMLYRANDAGAALPADQNVFIAQRLLQIGREHGFFGRDTGSVDEMSLERLIDAEEDSIAFAEQFPTSDALADWPTNRLRRLESRHGIWYALFELAPRGSCVALLSGPSAVSVLEEFVSRLQDDNVSCRILDGAGLFVAGHAEPSGEAFATTPLGASFANWTAELYFKDGDVFDRVASERIGLYTWAGVLVILLIVASGAFAAKAIGKQVKLNRLKNDFIATVTHELKTPLASMRLLVDTLLEGNYRDQQQVTDYLQLVSRENERLSRLIDNFLTFSRMERNKKAFQLRPTPAADIARAAVAAVMTKFSRGNCRFETDIPDDLPEVMADQDAMVTVLVNLLDNAYKYSHETKKITLDVGAEDGTVRFSVSDNGVGIPRRAARRIFKRFYQVDRRLSRRTEGCGLGLSIAKFIIDAHRGTISVDSRPGQGSTFSVRVPANGRTHAERSRR
jgi:signal transduction histidine kinase